jgi:thiosulfate/3-mercaptopyruvate sulfurtransferase
MIASGISGRLQRERRKKMKTEALFALLSPILIVSSVSGCSALVRYEAPSGRMIDPIVSTKWLNAHSRMENLVIIDIRSSADYAAGHIPGSINEPFQSASDPCTGPSSHWIIGTKDCLWLELPEANDLFDTIGKLGIAKDSKVVIVTSPNPEEPPFFGLANATRVADTLIYTGIANVAILDGGYPKWVSEGRTTTNKVPDLKSSAYQGQVNKAMFVPLGYVHKHIGKAIIIDARDADVYSGLVVESTANKVGHIPKAKSLPTPWIWKHNFDGTYTYKDPKTLGKMASGVIGKPTDIRRQEIIVYCGVGGYASAWWFVLTQVLGYDDVRIYDGSAQEWSRKHDMVID